MDELVRQVSERTGLPPDKARVAVDTVLSFLKERLPEPIASQLDSVAGSSAHTRAQGDLFGGLGGMLDRQ